MEEWSRSELIGLLGIFLTLISAVAAVVVIQKKTWRIMLSLLIVILIIIGFVLLKSNFKQENTKQSPPENTNLSTPVIGNTNREKPTPTTTTVTPTSSPTVLPETERNVNGVTVKLLSTKYSENTLIVSIRFISQGIDRHINIDNDVTRIFAVNTEFTKPKFLFTGDKETNSTGKDLIGDVPLDMQVIFRNLPNNIELIDVFEIKVSVRSPYLPATFKNLKSNFVYAK